MCAVALQGSVLTDLTISGGVMRAEVSIGAVLCVIVDKIAPGARSTLQGEGTFLLNPVKSRKVL